MRLSYFYSFIVFLLFLQACNEIENDSFDSQKVSVVKVEKEFEKMAAEKGIAEAFYFYADENAVIKRENDSLIKGRENIRKYYLGDFYKNASVKWSPDYVDVSSNGDMAYTYGNYIWQSSADSTGKISEYRGVFHTVWKKQADGTWKYVWD